MTQDRGCLKCQVTWYGGDECWFCHSTLFTVGAGVLIAAKPTPQAQHQYYEVIGPL